MRSIPASKRASKSACHELGTPPACCAQFRIASKYMVAKTTSRRVSHAAFCHPPCGGAVSTSCVTFRYSKLNHLSPSAGASAASSAFIVAITSAIVAGLPVPSAATNCVPSEAFIIAASATGLGAPPRLSIATRAKKKPAGEAGIGASSRTTRGSAAEDDAVGDERAVAPVAEHRDVLAGRGRVAGRADHRALLEVDGHRPALRLDDRETIRREGVHHADEDVIAVVRSRVPAGLPRVHVVVLGIERVPGTAAIRHGPGRTRIVRGLRETDRAARPEDAEPDGERANDVEG